MVIASKQMTRVHNLDDKAINICSEDKHLEQVPQFKLRETTLGNNLDWDNHINIMIQCLKLMSAS